MNKRLSSLIQRGYPEDLIIKLSNYTTEDVEKASEYIFKQISKDCNPVSFPVAMFIGGQPGCGKSIHSMKLKKVLKNTIEIGIDNYRTYHPHYLEMEKAINDHWKNKISDENNSPGNDIADFTHAFASDVTDALINIASNRVDNKSYNILLEWGMRNPVEPLKCMANLKEKKYFNCVTFVATNKFDSYEACKIRADVMKDYPHIIRKVPKSFHDYAVETLPESIDTIYNESIKTNTIDYLTLINREGIILWSSNIKESPKKIYESVLNNKDNNLSLPNNEDLALITDKTEMEGLIGKISGIKPYNESVITSINMNAYLDNINYQRK